MADLFTRALHDSAHQFIPHMIGNHCTTTIQCGNSRYTITITKEQDSPIPYHTPLFVPATSPSILGKRTYSLFSPEPLELNHKEHRSATSVNASELYPEFGHNFIPDK